VLSLDKLGDAGHRPTYNVQARVQCSVVENEAFDKVRDHWVSSITLHILTIKKTAIDGVLLA